MNFRQFLLLSFPIFLFSCNSNIIFEQKQEVSNQNWDYADTLNFNFNIADTTKVYNLFLEVEHSVDYGSQNLYVQILTKFPSEIRQKSLISLELADKTGAWFGDCGSQYCQINIPIQENIFFQEIGDYEITLKQYMRINPLAAVKSFKVRIEETGEIKG